MAKVGLGLALLIALALSFGAGWLSKLVVSGITATTAIQAATILATVSLAVWNYRKTKEKEIEARLFTQKAAVYEPLLDIFKRMQLANKEELGGVPLDQNELAKLLIDIQFKAIIWGDQKLIHLLIEWGDMHQEDPIELTFKRMSDIYRQMRTELGHRDDAGVGYDILTLLIIPEERTKMREIKQRALAGKSLT